MECSSQSAPCNVGDETIVENFSTEGVDKSVKIEMDKEATSFSIQSAYFFAEMCEICYKPESEVKVFLEKNDFWGSGVSAGDNFEWFEADDAAAGKSSFDAIHDTQAFVAANDDSIMVVFRGTRGGRDWLTNLSILPRDIPDDWNLEAPDGDLHRGFDDGVSTVWLPGPGHPEGMHATIKKFYDEEGKSRKLYVAGHSLGGALATVATARLVFVDDMNIAGLYTIGSPRVFDAEVAEIFDNMVNHGTPLKDKCFLSRNNNDIVARIPPSPYVHIGTEVYFDRFGAISTANLMDRLLGRWSALLRFTFIDGINDHAGFVYCRLYRQALVNSRLSLVHKTRSIVVDAIQKVLPVNTEAVKAQQEGFEAAKLSALKASTADGTFVPENVPAHLVQPGEA